MKGVGRHHPPSSSLQVEVVEHVCIALLLVLHAHEVPLRCFFYKTMLITKHATS